jgi:hypothetical protein
MRGARDTYVYETYEEEFMEGVHDPDDFVDEENYEE